MAACEVLVKHSFPNNPGYKRGKGLSGMKTFTIRKIEARTFKKGKEHSPQRGQEALSQEETVHRDILITPWKFLSQTIMQGRVSQLTPAGLQPASHGDLVEVVLNRVKS